MYYFNSLPKAKDPPRKSKILYETLVDINFP